MILKTLTEQLFFYRKGPLKKNKNSHVICHSTPVYVVNIYLVLLTRCQVDISHTYCQAAWLNSLKNKIHLPGGMCVPVRLCDARSCSPLQSAFLFAFAMHVAVRLCDARSCSPLLSAFLFTFAMHVPVRHCDARSCSCYSPFQCDSTPRYEFALYR